MQLFLLMMDLDRSETCRGYKWNLHNTLRINRAQIWFNLRDCIEMHGQQNVKFSTNTSCGQTVELLSLRSHDTQYSPFFSLDLVWFYKMYSFPVRISIRAVRTWWIRMLLRHVDWRKCIHNTQENNLCWHCGKCMHYVVVIDRWLKYFTEFIPRQVPIAVMWCPFCRCLAEVRYSLSNLVFFFLF